MNAEKLRFNWELGRNLLKVVFVCLVKCVQFLAVDVKDCRNPAAFQQGTTISLRLSAEQAMWPGNRPTSGAEAQGISLPLSCSLSISEVNIFFLNNFATLTLFYGADLYIVSKLLGHSNVRTTQINSKIMDESKRKAVNLIPKL